MSNANPKVDKQKDNKYSYDKNKYRRSKNKRPYSAGKATKTLKVYLDESGKVLNAYPIGG